MEPERELLGGGLPRMKRQRRTCPLELPTAAKEKSDLAALCGEDFVSSRLPQRQTGLHRHGPAPWLHSAVQECEEQERPNVGGVDERRELFDRDGADRRVAVVEQVGPHIGILERARSVP